LAPVAAGKMLLPAGSMREPLSALRRASAVVLTRVPSDSPGTTEMQLIQKFANVPTFCAENQAARVPLRERC